MTFSRKIRIETNVWRRIFDDISSWQVELANQFYYISSKYTQVGRSAPDFALDYDSFCSFFANNFGQLIDGRAIQVYKWNTI